METLPNGNENKTDKESNMVQEMKWEDARQLIERRLNKLAMCKRGIVETDINKAIEELGTCPTFTKEEREQIKAKTAHLVQRAMTPTIAMVKRAASLSSLVNSLHERARKATKNQYVHPEAAEWNRNLELLREQKRARIATLDSDFQDVQDEFLLGAFNIEDFPNKFNELESREW